MKKKKRRYHYNTTEDKHHILFQGRHWHQGYARALREHEYLVKYIPRDTLHREIHSKIHDVPVPRGKECRIAFEELCHRERLGLIDIEHDTIEQRIDFLIEMWQEANCEATIAILKWQKQIVSKFYGKPSE